MWGNVCLHFPELEIRTQDVKEAHWGFPTDHGVRECDRDEVQRNWLWVGDPGLTYDHPYSSSSWINESVTVVSINYLHSPHLSEEGLWYVYMAGTNSFISSWNYYKVQKALQSGSKPRAGALGASSRLQSLPWFRVANLRQNENFVLWIVSVIYSRHLQLWSKCISAIVYCITHFTPFFLTEELERVILRWWNSVERLKRLHRGCWHTLLVLIEGSNFPGRPFHVIFRSTSADWGLGLVCLLQSSFSVPCPIPNLSFHHILTSSIVVILSFPFGSRGQRTCLKLRSHPGQGPLRSSRTKSRLGYFFQCPAPSSVLCTFLLFLFWGEEDDGQTPSQLPIRRK